jgi:hypothetical protein
MMMHGAHDDDDAWCLMCKRVYLNENAYAREADTCIDSTLSNAHTTRMRRTSKHGIHFVFRYM